MMTGMAKYEVPVTPCEVWAVTTAFDTDDSGQICLDKLMHFFRVGGLCEARREVVDKLYRNLDSANTGAVPLACIREACDFSRLPAVVNGKAWEEEVRVAFLQHLHNTDESMANEVTAEHFQDAFRDIGAACIQLEASSCEPAARGPRQGRKEAGHLDVDVDVDRNVGDTLFMGVASSLGG